MDSLTDFFNQNELRINQFLSKALIFCVGIFLLLGGACVFGLFPDINTKIVLNICFIGIVTLLILVPLVSFWRNSHAMKYIIICAITLMNLSVACIPNMRVYLTFLLPPLLSFFYASGKFTLFTSIINGVSYLLAIGARCLFEADDTFTLWTRKEYFLAFGFGGLVELTAYCFVLYFLTRTTSQLLRRTYLRRKRLNEIHDFMQEGLSQVTESKNKNLDGQLSR